MTSQNDNYNEWHACHADENDVNTPWHNFVKEVLQPADIDDKKILEIGCGRGGFSNYLVANFKNIGTLYACDYSKSALQIGIDKSISPAIVWQQEDIQNLSFQDNTFDTIISCETIEHISFPLKGLSEIYRVLKPGGRLILTCPNYFNLFGIWCLYRKLIGKPYTEGGQPYVRYILIPFIYGKLKTLGFTVEHFHSAELVLPARVPKTFYGKQVPALLKYFGSRTFYNVIKK